jgi:indole-3-acetate monooxygenase
MSPPTPRVVGHRHERQARDDWGVAEELRKERLVKSHVTHFTTTRRSIDTPRSGSLPAKRLLAEIRKLAPQIKSRARDIEAARRIPPGLVKTLRSIGVFRMLMPRSHGGFEIDLPAALEILSTLSRIDGSVGWTMAIASAGDLFLPLLRRDTYDEVYRSGPDVVIAGSVQPAGTAEPTAGGWRVSGRWPFASGCQHADWMLGFCTMSEGGKPLAGEAGAPLVRGFVLPARDWMIEDTWYVAGLRGTGSHHITLRDALVPEGNFFDLNGAPCLPGPLYGAVRSVLPLLHGSVSVGMAEGAVDELVELANTGRHQLRAPAPMRDSEVFQHELGRIVGDLRAAQALLQVQTASHWRHALAGTLRDDALVTQATQAATWIVTTCVRVADACFALGGGSALYDSSPLQRRLRDLHAAAQHAAVQQRNYASAGKLILNSTRVGAEVAAQGTVRPAHMLNVRPLPIRRGAAVVDATLIERDGRGE